MHSRRTLPTQRSARAFARGERTGVLITLAPSEVNTLSNAMVNLVSRSRMRNLRCSARPPRSMSRFRACWATHGPVGFVVAPMTSDVHGSADVVDGEQDVDPLEEHGVDVEEITCPGPHGLGVQELPPLRHEVARGE
jgi:hypothetical protein